jgi:ribosome-binding factor A
MAKEFSRKQRVASQIQKELAILIQQDLKDPRLGMVTVSAVEIAADLRNAKVYVTVFANTSPASEVLQILNSAAGFLRHALAQRIELRVSPVLLFVYDVSVERGAALNALINSAIATENKTPQK